MKSRYQHHCGSVYYLKTLFWFGSHSLMMPYRIIYNTQTASYHIKLFKYRKFIIWLLQVALTVQLVTVVLHGLIADHSFKSCIIGTINLSLAMWTNITLFNMVNKKDVFLKILENVETIGIDLKKWGGKTPKRFTVIAVVLGLCIGSILVSILEIVFLDLKFHLHNSSLMVYDLLIRRAKYILYCISNKGSYEFITTPTNATNLSDYVAATTGGGGGAMMGGSSRYDSGAANSGSTSELIFGSVSLFIIKFYYLNVGHFGYVTLFVFIFLLAKLYATLDAGIPKQFHQEAEIEKVIQLYRDLCDLTTQINDAIGKLLAWGILVHLPYNAYKTKDLLLNDVTKQLSYMLHIMMYGGILVFGAKVHTHANSIMDKIASSRLIMDNEKLHSKITLLLQMTRNVGLRGSQLFLLTYGFFGNIVGVILTYAILIAQFQSHCT